MTHQHPPIIVANRLPVRVVRDADTGAVDVTRASGGLATALREVQRRRTGARWLGWPGDVDVDDNAAAAIRSAIAADDLIPIFLTRAEASAYYEEISNGVLWPVLHSNIDKLPLAAHDAFRVYRSVNERFADASCAAAADNNSPIWIHDFHLALVPEAIRRRQPDARVGFFLHVPFPPVEIFRILPWARELLVGMLGADVVGFHTAAYARAFAASVKELLGVDVDGDLVSFAGHTSRIGVFPISIDVQRVEESASSPSVVERVRSLREEARGRKILLGVDRLDYTKGIRRRLLALELLLERWPALSSQVHFVQVAVPTRENVDAYAEHRGSVNELVGRINGKHGTAMGVPIHFLHREIPFDELVALYAAADVMIVTPTRDGMNLVCKEYVAARVDESGVLVLSELAGASAELGCGALVVNPYDLEGVATKLRQAIAMPLDEQRARMAGMRRVVAESDVYRWADSFLDELDDSDDTDAVATALLRAATVEGTLHVVLDYDGTLASIEATPAQAEPDDELHSLLRALAAASRTEVHITSGRDRAALTSWFDALPLSLHAEHGAHVKPAGGEWQRAAAPLWLAEVERVLTDVAGAHSGAFIERKETSVALHVRNVPAHVRCRAADAACDALEALRTGHTSLAILRGEHTIEARVAGVDKGRSIRAVLALAPHDVVLAAGNDTTDEDLFAALPDDAVTIAVGDLPKKARVRFTSPLELRTFLARIATARR